MSLAVPIFFSLFPTLYLVLKFFLILNAYFRCQGFVLFVCMVVLTGSVLALGAIVSAKPLDDLDYKGLTGEQKGFTSPPYASSVYIGWAMASAIALLVTGVLPIVSWFATYRFSLSSAVCVGIFTGKYQICLIFLLIFFDYNISSARVGYFYFFVALA